MEGEEAEETERRRGNKATDLGGIDGIEVEILDFRTDQGALAQGFVKSVLHGAGVNAGKINEMKVEAGLSSGGDDEKWNEGQRGRAIPEKAPDHQHEKEIEPVEKFLVVGVLHFAHTPKLFHPKIDLSFRFHHERIMPRGNKKDNLVTFPPADFGRRYPHGAAEKLP